MFNCRYLDSSLKTTNTNRPLNFDEDTQTLNKITPTNEPAKPHKNATTTPIVNNCHLKSIKIKLFYIIYLNYS